MDMSRECTGEISDTTIADRENNNTRDEHDDVFSDGLPRDSSERKTLNDEFVRQLANDFIHFRLHGDDGRDCCELLQNPTTRNRLKRNLSLQELSTLKRAKQVLRSTSVELEHDYADFFGNVVTDTDPETAKLSFRTISEEVLCQDKLNWGRVVSLFVYGGRLAEEFWKSRQEDKVGEVEEWLTEYISQKDEWIDEQGGWDNFIEKFTNGKEEWYKLLVKPLFLVVGVSVLSYLSMKLFSRT